MGMTIEQRNDLIDQMLVDYKICFTKHFPCKRPLTDTEWRDAIKEFDAVAVVTGENGTEGVGVGLLGRLSCTVSGVGSTSFSFLYFCWKALILLSFLLTEDGIRIVLE